MTEQGDDAMCANRDNPYASCQVFLRILEALLVYQQFIQGVFCSVSDALVAYRKTRQFRVQEAAHLSRIRYTRGVTGYLEVLTNETNAFSAELARVRARQNELLALVQLYEALGGGWQQ
jgi:multidrug efflux system outer membrane protein